MRIRGYSEETEELSADLITIKGDIADLTKTANSPNGVRLFTDTDNDTYRSTYDILKDIADVWDDLSDVNQAKLLEKLFGKTRAQAGASILRNFESAEKALKVMEEASGSADKEMDNIKDSIEYISNEIKQTWTGLKQELLGREEIKVFLNTWLKISETIANVGKYLGVGGIINVGVALLASMLTRKTRFNLFGYDPKASKGNRFSIFNSTLATRAINRENRNSMATMQSWLGRYNSNNIGSFEFGNASRLRASEQITEHDFEMLSRYRKQVTDLNAEVSNGGTLFDSYNRWLVSTGNATKKASVGTKLLSAGVSMLNTVVKSIAMYAVFTLVEKAISSVYDAIDRTINKVKYLQEDVDKAKTKYEESVSTLEKYEQELENINNQIDAFQKKDSLTFVEQHELDKLIKAREETQLLVNQLKELKQVNAKEYLDAQQKLYDEKFSGNTSKSLSYVTGKSKGFYGTADLLNLFGLNYEKLNTSDLLYYVNNVDAINDLMANESVEEGLTNRMDEVYSEYKKEALEMIDGIIEIYDNDLSKVIKTDLYKSISEDLIETAKVFNDTGVLRTYVFATSDLIESGIEEGILSFVSSLSEGLTDEQIFDKTNEYITNNFLESLIESFTERCNELGIDISALLNNMYAEATDRIDIKAQREQLQKKLKYIGTTMYEFDENGNLTNEVKGELEYDLSQAYVELGITTSEQAEIFGKLFNEEIKNLKDNSYEGIDKFVQGLVKKYKGATKTFEQFLITYKDTISTRKSDITTINTALQTLSETGKLDPETIISLIETFPQLQDGSDLTSISLDNLRDKLESVLLEMFDGIEGADKYVDALKELFITTTDSDMANSIREIATSAFTDEEGNILQKSTSTFKIEEEKLQNYTENFLNEQRKIWLKATEGVKGYDEAVKAYEQQWQEYLDGMNFKQYLNSEVYSQNTGALNVLKNAIQDYTNLGFLSEESITGIAQDSLLSTFIGDSVFNEAVTEESVNEWYGIVRQQLVDKFTLEGFTPSQIDRMLAQYDFVEVGKTIAKNVGYGMSQFYDGLSDDEKSRIFGLDFNSVDEYVDNFIGTIVGRSFDENMSDQDYSSLLDSLADAKNTLTGFSGEVDLHYTEMSTTYSEYIENFVQGQEITEETLDDAISYINNMIDALLRGGGASEEYIQSFNGLNSVRSYLKANETELNRITGNLSTLNSALGEYADNSELSNDTLVELVKTFDEFDSEASINTNSVYALRDAFLEELKALLLNVEGGEELYKVYEKLYTTTSKIDVKNRNHLLATSQDEYEKLNQYTDGFTEKQREIWLESSANALNALQAYREYAKAYAQYVSTLDTKTFMDSEEQSQATSRIETLKSLIDEYTENAKSGITNLTNDTIVGLDSDIYELLGGDTSIENIQKVYEQLYNEQLKLFSIQGLSEEYINAWKNTHNAVEITLEYLRDNSDILFADILFDDDYKTVIDNAKGWSSSVYEAINELKKNGNLLSATITSLLDDSELYNKLNGSVDNLQLVYSSILDETYSTLASKNQQYADAWLDSITTTYDKIRGRLSGTTDQIEAEAYKLESFFNELTEPQQTLFMEAIKGSKDATEAINKFVKAYTDMLSKRSFNENLFSDGFVNLISQFNSARNYFDEAINNNGLTSEALTELYNSYSTFLEPFLENGEITINTLQQASDLIASMTEEMLKGSGASNQYVTALMNVGGSAKSVYDTEKSRVDDLQTQYDTMWNYLLSVSSKNWEMQTDDYNQYVTTLLYTYPQLVDTLLEQGYTVTDVYNGNQQAMTLLLDKMKSLSVEGSNATIAYLNTLRNSSSITAEARTQIDLLVESLTRASNLDTGWDSTFAVLDDMQNEVDNIAQLMNTLATNGDNLLKMSEWRQYIEMFPELVEQAVYAGNGMMQINNDVLKAWLDGKQVQIKTSADQKISELEDERDVLEAKIAMEQSKIAIAQKALESNSAVKKSQALEEIKSMAQTVEGQEVVENEKISQLAESSEKQVDIEAEKNKDEISQLDSVVDATRDAEESKFGMFAETQSSEVELSDSASEEISKTYINTENILNKTITEGSTNFARALNNATKQASIASESIQRSLLGIGNMSASVATQISNMTSGKVTFSGKMYGTGGAINASGTIAKTTVAVEKLFDVGKINSKVTEVKNALTLVFLKISSAFSKEVQKYDSQIQTVVNDQKEKTELYLNGMNLLNRPEILNNQFNAILNGATSNFSIIDSLNAQLQGVIDASSTAISEYQKDINTINGKIEALKAFQSLDNVKGIVNKAISDLAKDNNGNSGSESGKEPTELDWIEIKIKRIEEAIQRLEKVSSNTFKVFSTRNKAYLDELDKLNEELEVQQQAYIYYSTFAEAVNLSEEYKKKVREGAIEIESIGDETLKSQIERYQQYYEKAVGSADAVEDLAKDIAEVYKSQFELIESEFERMMKEIENKTSMLDAYISKTQSLGYAVSENYYKAQKENTEIILNTLKQQYDALWNEFNTAKLAGTVERDSEEWENYSSTLDQLWTNIVNTEKEIAELENSYNEALWAKFDRLQEALKQANGEMEFMLSLMDEQKAYDKDSAEVTESGIAMYGLYAEQYELALSNVEKYREELRKANDELNADPLNQTLIDRVYSLTDGLQDAVSQVKNLEEAFKNLVKNGIDASLAKMKKLIDDYTTALDRSKDVYDYQKTIDEKTKNINSLSKQITALSGDTSEANIAKLQQLNKEYVNAQEDLQETQYQRYISDQKEILSDMYDDYEEVLNKRLDDVSTLIASIIDGVNNNTTTIYDKLTEVAESYGYDIQNGISEVFNTQGATNAITAVGESVALSMADQIEAIKQFYIDSNNIEELTKFEDYLLNMQDSQDEFKVFLDDIFGRTVGDSITSNISGMATLLSRIDENVAKQYEVAEEMFEQNTEIVDTVIDVDNLDKSVTDVGGKDTSTPTETQTSINGNVSSNVSSSDKNDTNVSNPKYNDEIVKGIATAIWLSGNYGGWGTDPERKKRLTDKLGADGALAVQNYINNHARNSEIWNDWVKNGKYDLNQFKFNAFWKGTKSVAEDMMALTQEKGLETIVRPDGSLLTPLEKNSLVLNSDATDNFWNMMNNPKGFFEKNVNGLSKDASIVSGINNSNVGDVNVQINCPNITSYNEFMNFAKNDSKVASLFQCIVNKSMRGQDVDDRGRSRASLSW